MTGFPQKSHNTNTTGKACHCYCCCCLCVSRPITAEITASQPRCLLLGRNNIYEPTSSKWHTWLFYLWESPPQLVSLAWIHQLLTCDPIWPGDELIGNCPSGKFWGRPDTLQTVNLLSLYTSATEKCWFQPFSKCLQCLVFKLCISRIFKNNKLTMCFASFRWNAN